MRALFGALLVAFVLTLPSYADAARVWSSGCELQTPNQNDGADAEWNATGSQGSAFTISTSVFHSGLASCRFAVTSGSYEIMFQDFADNSSAPWYMRAYVYFDAAPSSNSQFMVMSNSDDEGAIGIGTDMTLRLYGDDMTTVQATAASALSTGTWYRIEWFFEAGGSSIVRVDGTEVLNDATNDGDAAGDLLLGPIGINFGGTTQTIYFDDVAINSDLGAAQTSWPGAGNIIHLQADSAGDNNGCSAGTYADVDEVIPDGDTSFCVLDADTGGDILDVNAESSSSGGVDSYDTVTLVQVGVRERQVSAAAATWELRLKSASGGTTSTGTATSHNDTTYKTNGDLNPATPGNYTLTSYTDPTTGIAWTPTGTNSLDNMQYGINCTDCNPDTRVTTLWALVEYVDGAAPGATEKMRARINGGRLKVQGGRFKLQSN